MFYYLRSNPRLRILQCFVGGGSGLKKKKKVTLFEVRSLGVHSDPGLSSSSY